ncbi:hypothetical protein BGZ46_004881, partial [Entomortierella lignicola]
LEAAFVVKIPRFLDYVLILLAKSVVAMVVQLQEEEVADQDIGVAKMLILEAAK